MPAREVHSPNDVGSTLLRRHKVLPHPRPDTLSPHAVENILSKPRSLKINTSSTPNYSRSRVSSSGSPTSNKNLTILTNLTIPAAPTNHHVLKHATKKLQPSALPPTPPTHSRESSTVSSTCTPEQRENRTPNGTTASPNTPSHQRSPPTPDVTPPKASRPMALRPPASERYPSSARTDSFKTARETPYASEEDEQSTIRPNIPSNRPSQNLQKLSDRGAKKNIGLGLGLETDTESVTTPRTVVHDDFNAFDGEWSSGNEEISEVEREWDHNLMRNVTVRKRREEEPHMITPRPSKQEVINDREISPSNATRALHGNLLQDRIIKHRRHRELTDHISSEDSKPKIVSVQDSEHPSTPTSTEKRLSKMSTRSATSTIVEVRVIDTLDTLPQRQRTLRHTKKQIGLRSVSEPVTSLVSGSVVANSGPRLVRKASGILKEPESQAAPSIASNTSTKRSTSQNTTQSKPPTARALKDVWENGSIPVVVVPERRSSSNSKPPSLRSTSSRRTQRSASLTSAPLSQTSKVNVGGFFELPKKRARTLSESASSSQRTMDFAPRIPARTSSLSAPTSRNTSRAGSLTAASLKAHNASQPLHIAIEPPRSPPAKKVNNEKEESKDGIERISSPFGQGLSALSAQMTPFSNVSYATTGTPVSISEAQLVTMHQHQNESVTVVDHSTSTNTSPVSPPPSKPRIETLPPPNLPSEPHTPANQQHPIDDENSPLRFPREAPKPPAIQLILATPAAMTPGAEESRQLGYDYNSPLAPSPPQRRPSILRRALGASETFIPSGLRRTFSKKGTEDEGGEGGDGGDGEEWVDSEIPREPGRLHPFWQPGGFWDGVDGVDVDEEVERVPRRGSWKRTFAILPVRDERLSMWSGRSESTGGSVLMSGGGNAPVTINGNRNGNINGHTNMRPLKRANTSKSSLTVRRRGTIPALGLRWEYVGIRGLWRGVRERKVERRMERRRKELRARIGRPRLVGGGWI